VKQGEPLLLRYGTHSNADLLLSYGFVVNDNPFDAYAFPFDVDFVLVRYLGGGRDEQRVVGVLGWCWGGLRGGFKSLKRPMSSPIQRHHRPYRQPIHTIGTQQGAVQQFVGATSATDRPSNGLKTWQRTVLSDLGLLGGFSDKTSGSNSGSRGGSSGEPLKAEPDLAADIAAADTAADTAAAAPAVVVSIGGEPPVKGPLLAALRVMLSEVRGCT